MMLLPLGALIFAVVLELGLASFGGLTLLLDRLELRRATGRERRVAQVALVLLIVGAGCFSYGALIEVDWLEVTRTEVLTPLLPPGERLRIVQLSDLHVEGMTRALAELPAQIDALRPDLLVFTGDSINRLEDLPLFRETLERTHPRFGRFAVKGNHDVHEFGGADFFGGGVAEELDGTPRLVASGRLTLCGASYGNPAGVERCLLQTTGLRVAVYHTPDLVESLEPLGPTLYLAGHTHGGQVRLPFFGAMVTMSRFGKKYEMGRYQVGATALYVNRGIGVEGAPAPRVRFLCRPEIAVVDLVGQAR